MAIHGTVAAQGFASMQVHAERFLNLRYEGTDVAVMTPCPADGDYATVRAHPLLLCLLHCHGTCANGVAIEAPSKRLSEKCRDRRLSKKCLPKGFPRSAETEALCLCECEARANKAFACSKM